MKKKVAIIWSIVFVAIIFLSQDYLFFDWSTDLSFAGFPSWLSWFVFVHILFLGVLYWFSSKYWKE